MKAVGVCAGVFPAGDVSSLVDLDLPEPEAPQGRDLLVRILAVSVNPRDVKSRKAPAPSNEPLILGYDACGVVEAVGKRAELFHPGDEVFYAGVLGRAGSNAEFQTVDERIVGRKPVTLSYGDAASMPLTALTAYEMLFDRLEIPPKTSRAAPATLLVLGGAGGVPSMAIQLARVLTSVTVVASASRRQSEAWVRKLGAHHVIDHSRPIAEQVANLPDLPPVQYVLSTHTNAAVWAQLAELIAPQGRIGLIDDPGPLDLGLMKMKSVSIHWEAMFTRPLFETPDMIRQHQILNEVARLTDAGKLKAATSNFLGRINAFNLRRAHTSIEAGRTMGKIVLAGF